MTNSKEANVSTTAEPALDSDAIDTNFHQVDLGGKEPNDIIDSEIQHIDSEETDKKNDSLYKDEPLINDKRVASRRRRFLNIVALALGLISLIILVSTLVKAKDVSAASKKDASDEDASNKDKAPIDNTKPKTAESVTPQFTCSSTIVSCPEYINGTWTKLPDDILGEGMNDYAGFATALSCDGSILAISSIYNKNETGHVRVFKWENSAQSWMQMGRDIEGTSPDEEFGYSLTMSGDGYQIAIGSRKNSDKANEAGEVRVFAYFDHVWLQIGQDIEGEFGGDHSGRSVSLSMDGSRLAIGASRNNGTAPGAGHARVFEAIFIDGTKSWVQMGQDLDGEEMGEQFGRSIALSGDGRRVAVGGHTHDTSEGIVDAGHVIVFEYDSAAKAWTQIANTIDGQKTNEYFGIAVSFSYDGSRLAIGSPNSDAYIFGVTRVYELSNGAWSQLGSNLFGGGNTIDMTLDGNRVVIGSNKAFVDSGLLSVYEYDESTLSWSQIGGVISGIMGEKSATSVAISADGKRVVSSSPSSGTFNGTDNNGIAQVFDFC
jgi:hypothetical protein